MLKRALKPGRTGGASGVSRLEAANAQTGIETMENRPKESAFVPLEAANAQTGIETDIWP